MSDDLTDLFAAVLSDSWEGNIEGVGYGVEPDEQALIGAALASVVRDYSSVFLRALGLHPVAMSDSDCGWVVSSSVEAAGAWSTVPDGGWTRADRRGVWVRVHLFVAAYSLLAAVLLGAAVRWMEPTPVPAPALCASFPNPATAPACTR